jgi:hypothetical protein
MRALPESGGCRVVLALLGRLRESFAQLAQLRDFRGVQLRIPVCHVLHRFLKPFRLVLGGGPDHAASHDVLEQLVAGLLEGSGDRCSARRSISLLRHVLGVG